MSKSVSENKIAESLKLKHQHQALFPWKGIKKKKAFYSVNHTSGDFIKNQNDLFLPNCRLTILRLEIINEISLVHEFSFSIFDKEI